MASACVNNVTVPPSYGVFSPRVSFSRDFPPTNGSDPPDINAGSDLDSKDFIDFEFHLNDPVAMLPADELFSDGKLVPLQLAPVKPAPDSDPDPTAEPIRLPDTPLKPVRREELIGSGSDFFAVSPKAPTCSSRWRELLRLKRQQQTTSKADPGSRNLNPKSLKHFLNRNLRSSSSSDPNLNLPLLKESETEPLSISSRLSLSSTSSSGPESEELPRLSLDSEHKPNQAPILLNRNPPKVRVSRARTGAEGRVSVRAGRSPVRRPAESVAPPPRCSSVDSPRMNASGKVVFQGLGRSSSSPSTFNGGPRIKHRGMERSYSANVRVTPVLNVPVCSLRAGSKSFGSPLFDPPTSIDRKPPIRQSKKPPASAMVNATELWQTLDHAIVHYTGLSPATFFTVLAVAAALYHVVSGWFRPPPPPPRKREAEFEQMEPLPPPVQLGEITEEELSAYDGSDSKKPLLMAIKGQIYDVTQSRMFYGPGGPYALFAGKDASRALAKMSFEQKDLTGDISGLGPFELEALQDWEYKFMSKYVKVGTVKKTVPVTEASTSEATEPSTQTTERGPIEDIKEEDTPAVHAKSEEDETTERGPVEDIKEEDTPAVHAKSEEDASVEGGEVKEVGVAEDSKE